MLGKIAVPAEYLVAGRVSCPVQAHVERVISAVLSRCIEGAALCISATVNVVYGQEHRGGFAAASTPSAVVGNDRGAAPVPGCFLVAPHSRRVATVLLAYGRKSFLAILRALRTQSFRAKIPGATLAHYPGGPRLVPSALDAQPCLLKSVVPLLVQQPLVSHRLRTSRHDVVSVAYRLQSA